MPSQRINRKVTRPQHNCPNAPSTHKCHSCQQSFLSRTKLFKHLRSFPAHFIPRPAAKELTPMRTNQQPQIVQVQGSDLGLWKQGCNWQGYWRFAILEFIGICMLFMLSVVSTRTSSFSLGRAGCYGIRLRSGPPDGLRPLRIVT